jgi:two-component system, cell cycle sensor histidine kinase and response regulator CckA
MERRALLVHLQESPAATRRLAASLELQNFPCELTGVACEQALLRAVVDTAVDAALITISPRSVNPAALTRKLRAAAPHVSLIGLTSLENPELELALLQAGASDCLPQTRVDRLAWALRRVVAARDEHARADRLQAEVVAIEAQLRHAQRLAHVARLAGSVAHDFNNLLTVINGCCQLLLRSLPEDHELRQLVEPIEQAGARGADLTKKLLSFSRAESSSAQLVSLNEVIEDLQPMLTALIGEQVKLSLNLDSSLWLVRADAGELGQVVMNLVTNARDAMKDGGVVAIRTGNVDLIAGASPSAGSYVELVVRDGGCGMNEDVRARIFDPFFTTKPVGEGTGLGLATVHRIVSQSGGEIDVETAPGRGTSMRIRLPRADADGPRPQSRDLADDEAATAGSETVLVVEDEVGVRDIVCWFLRGGGYRVIEAGDAESAEALCRAQAEPIDLLVSDVVLPGASGPRLAQRLKAVVPGLKTLFISGYPAEAISQSGLDADGWLLPKPFSREVLLQSVRKTLSAQPRTSGTRL